MQKIKKLRHLHNAATATGQKVAERARIADCVVAYCELRQRDAPRRRAAVRAAVRAAARVVAEPGGAFLRAPLRALRRVGAAQLRLLCVCAHHRAS